MKKTDPYTETLVNFRDLLLNNLNRDGYIILKNFASANEIKCLQNFSNYVEGVVNGGVTSDSVQIVSEDQDYIEMRNSKNTVAQIRGCEKNYDKGMIDIFNPHFAALERFNELEELFLRLKDDSLISLFKRVNPLIKPCNTNLYLHRGVTAPRVAHVDSIRDYFKGFLAISDHTLDGSGPLCVIPGSHQAKLKNYLMCFYNRRVLRRTGGEVTDASFYSSERLVPLMLQPGDLALCNVSMVHGASPSKSAGYRSTLVQCYDL